MPNPKISARERAFQYEKHGFFASDKSTVMCKFCNCHVAWERKDSIEKHLKSSKHIAAVNKKRETPKLQTSIATCFSSVVQKRKDTEYLGRRLAETFLKANIPLYKLENEHVKSFINEFVEGSGDIPCTKVLREKYLPKMKEEREAEIKMKLNDKLVAIFCDETTDKRGKCTFVILFKIIDAGDAIDIVVGDVHTLESADSKTCSRAILDTMNKLNIQHDNVVALVSDSARYMVKCFEVLKPLMADTIIIVQCWAHKLNIVLTVLGKHLPELQAAVSKVKSAFLNTRKRKHLFRNFLDKMYPGQNVPQFPMPVLTRWSSWFESVVYLSDHLKDVVTFMKSEDVLGVNNAGVDFLHTMEKDELLAAQAAAAFVQDVGQGIVDLIKLLEGHSYPTVHLLDGHLRRIEQSLQLAATGNHSSKTRAEMETCSNIAIKQKIMSTLNNAASHAVTKLISMRSSDPAGAYYKGVSVFDPAEIVAMDVSQQLIKRVQKLRFFSDLQECDIAKGYLELQYLVKNKIHVENNAVVPMLLGMTLTNPDFAKAALKAIWMPCANADCERFFSSYNNVLTDKRHSLRQDNLCLLSEMYFEG